jgi:hypothetical protein
MRHIDRHFCGGNSGEGGVRDRTAADLAQIKLILRIEIDRACKRALDQIEAVLREAYPDAW